MCGYFLIFAEVGEQSSEQWAHSNYWSQFLPFPPPWPECLLRQERMICCPTAGRLAGTGGASYYIGRSGGKRGPMQSVRNPQRPLIHLQNLERNVSTCQQFLSWLKNAGAISWAESGQFHCEQRRGKSGWEGGVQNTTFSSHWLGLNCPLCTWIIMPWNDK